LLECVQHGDPESRERLYRLYGRLVWKIYLAKVPEQDRMDLCQEVFRTVFQRIHEFQKTQNGGPAFRAWLHKIAYHKVGNYISGKRRDGLTVSNSDLEALMPEESDRPDESDPSGSDERTELVRAAFEEAAAKFEPRTVEAVRRLVFEDKPVRDVAADLGMSHGAVHIAKSRVLASVRAILIDLGELVGSTAGP
jgi:RNA polymerase sigma-70 factor (ECF subfamily)